jgi:hypothetical protein
LIVGFIWIVWKRLLGLSGQAGRWGMAKIDNVVYHSVCVQCGQDKKLDLYRLCKDCLDKLNIALDLKWAAVNSNPVNYLGRKSKAWGR